MKIAREYSFPRLFLRCFGKEEYLNQIDKLFDYSDISGTPVDIWEVLEIISVNQILSFAKGRTIAGKIDSINFNLLFKKYNILINEDEFNEYMFYTPSLRLRHDNVWCAQSRSCGYLHRDLIKTSHRF